MAARIIEETDVERGTRQPNPSQPTLNQLDRCALMFTLEASGSWLPIRLINSEFDVAYCRLNGPGD